MCRSLVSERQNVASDKCGPCSRHSRTEQLFHLHFPLLIPTAASQPNRRGIQMKKLLNISCQVQPTEEPRKPPFGGCFRSPFLLWGSSHTFDWFGSQVDVYTATFSLLRRLWHATRMQWSWQRLWGEPDRWQVLPFSLSWCKTICQLMMGCSLSFIYLQLQRRWNEQEEGKMATLPEGKERSVKYACFYLGCAELSPTIECWICEAGTDMRFKKVYLKYDSTFHCQTYCAMSCEGQIKSLICLLKNPTQQVAHKAEHRWPAM